MWGTRIIAAAMALAGGLWASAEAEAGTSGGIYDFRRFLGQGHPFAEDRPQPTAAPSAAPAQPASPPVRPAPTPRPAAGPATVPAANARAAPMVREDPLSDATDGWLNRLYVSVGALGVYTEDYDGSTAGTPFDVEFDLGFGLDLALGTYFTPAFRGEIAVTYRASGADKANIGGVTANRPDLTTWSLMLNGYYDFLRDWPVHPYLGGGFGVDFIDSDSFSAGGLSIDGKEDFELGAQLIAGLAWRLAERFALTLDYRYHASTDDDIFYHSVQGGVRYDF